MKNVLLSLFIILSPILVSQDATAVLLPCEKMQNELGGSMHSGHLMNDFVSAQMNGSDLNCSCDQNDCHILNHNYVGTILTGKFSDNNYIESVFILTNNPHLIVGVYTHPFRPPIS